MKKLIFGLFLMLIQFLMLTGCDEKVFLPTVLPPEGYRCYECKKGTEAFKDSCDEADKLAKFIIECARAANPMSDEEGEDLVKECGSQAMAIYCKREYILLK